MKLLFLISFLSTLITVKAEDYYLKVTQILSIYDGDTFKVNLDKTPALFGDNIPIRIANIDTPEIKGGCNREKVLARKAKQFTVEQLRNSKEILLKNPKRGKYFRIIAEVYIDGQNLGEELLKEGLAVKYDGGKRKNWCE